MNPTDLIRSFVAAHKAWDVIRWETSNPGKYAAAAHLADCTDALLAFVETLDKEWSCPVDSSECAIRRACTNKCGQKDPL